MRLPRDDASTAGLLSSSSCWPADTGTGSVLGGDWSEPGGAFAGRKVGRYRLLERLGRGRQAEVWRALRVEPDVREVALKFLPAAGHDPRGLAQLRREAERGARLDGPGLLRPFDFGEADGQVFLALPLVVGPSLAVVLEQRRGHLLGRGPTHDRPHRLATLPEPEYTGAVLGLIERVARAVAAAHAERVAHRDVKPANVLVPRDDREGAYLCDFGLGRDLDVATAAQLRDGAGTPLYMAPERLRREPADEFLCDVFALGVTLYEALTLAPPFAFPASRPHDEAVRLLAGSEPIPPSALRPDLPAPVAALVLRAMARDPARRHPTATAFAADVGRWGQEIRDGAGRPSRSGCGR